MRASKRLYYAIVFLSVGLGSIAAYVSVRLNQSRQSEHLLAEQTEQLSAQLKSALQTKVSLSETIEAMQENESTLTAKTENLTAQIDNLKRDLKSKNQALLELEAKNSEVAESLIQARRKLLEANRTAPPDPNLVAELENKIEYLKQTQEAHLATLSQMPNSVTYRLTSEDYEWIALEGNIKIPSQTHDIKTLICRKGSPIAWISIQAIEQNLVMAKVEDWIENASNLVKGENLFIFSFF